MKSFCYLSKHVGSKWVLDNSSHHHSSDYGPVRERTHKLAVAVEEWVGAEICAWVVSQLNVLISFISDHTIGLP